MNEYIKQSVEASKKNTLFGRDIVVIADSPPEDISITNVLQKVEMNIPPSLVKDLDAIYVGDFDLLKPRDLKAMYFKGTIYVSNKQDDEHDLYEALIHEISHHVEVLAKDLIYADGVLLEEFVNKRQKLFDILELHGYNVSISKMLNPKYDEELDEFFYWEIGYEKLASLIGGIFISPYAATSLREYWGKGFEEYIAGEREELAIISPKLYDRLENIFTLAYEGEII